RNQQDRSGQQCQIVSRHHFLLWRLSFHRHIQSVDAFLRELLPVSFVAPISAPAVTRETRRRQRNPESPNGHQIGNYPIEPADKTIEADHCPAFANNDTSASS